MSENTRGGLRFRTTKSLAVEDLLQRYDGIIDEADEVLAAEQIAGPLEMPERQDDLDAYITWHEKYNDPLPPSDLTEAPDLIIGKLFSFFQHWTNYVASTVTRAKCLRAIQQRNLDVLKSALTIYYREEKGYPAGLIKDYINVDPRFVEVDAALLKISVFYETASGREDQLRRTLNNISREQTRRANELERQLHDEKGGRGPSTGGERRRRFGKW